MEFMLQRGKKSPHVLSPDCMPDTLLVHSLLVTTLARCTLIAPFFRSYVTSPRSLNLGVVELVLAAWLPVPHSELYSELYCLSAKGEGVPG